MIYRICSILSSLFSSNRLKMTLVNLKILKDIKYLSFHHFKISLLNILCLKILL